MLQKSTLLFLKNLQKHNTKEWMDANKTAYIAAKSDWENLINQVIAECTKWEPQLAGQEAKKCTFRQNRDVRFSKNKDPYKNNFGASIKIDGKKSPYAGYYIHAQPYACFLGGGFYMPEPPVLAKIRQEIDYDLPAFTKIIKSAAFTKAYPAGVSKENTLVNIPKGYAIDNPAAEWLKLKSFVATSPLPEDVLTSPKAVAHIVATLKGLQPFIQFVNRAVE